MTVKEMHIEVEQSLQKVAAFKEKKYLPQEIDWALNKNQLRYIQTRLQRKNSAGGFEETQLGVDSITQLLVKLELPTYFDRKIDNDVYRYKVILPSNYSYLVDDSSWTYYLDKEVLVPVTQNIYVLPAYENTSNIIKYYYNNYNIRFNQVINGTSKLFEYDLRRLIPPGNVYNGEYKISDFSFLRMNILNSINASLVNNANEYDFEIYWEYYDNYYYPRSWIFVTKNTNVTLEKYNNEDVLSITNIDSLDSPQIQKINFLPQQTVYSTQQYNLSDQYSNAFLSKNRLINSSNVSKILKNPYYGPQSDSLITEIVDDNKLFIYTKNKFIISKSFITYIRKPAQINLSLGIDCELREEFHQTITDLTVEYLKGRVLNLAGFKVDDQDINSNVII